MCNSHSEATDIETKHIAAGPYRRVLEIWESVSSSMLTTRTLFPPDGLPTDCNATQRTSSSCGVAESDVDLSQVYNSSQTALEGPREGER